MMQIDDVWFILSSVVLFAGFALSYLGSVILQEGVKSPDHGDQRGQTEPPIRRRAPFTGERLIKGIQELHLKRRRLWSVAWILSSCMGVLLADLGIWSLSYPYWDSISMMSVIWVFLILFPAMVLIGDLVVYLKGRPSHP